MFGCICFAHLYLGQKDKLSVKSVKCIFLGYSRTQKEYYCYSPSLIENLVIAYVTFFEACSFYPLRTKISSLSLGKISFTTSCFEQPSQLTQRFVVPP